MKFFRGVLYALVFSFLIYLTMYVIGRVVLGG